MKYFLIDVLIASKFYCRKHSAVKQSIQNGKYYPTWLLSLNTVNLIENLLCVSQYVVSDVKTFPLSRLLYKEINTDEKRLGVYAFTALEAASFGRVTFYFDEIIPGS